MPFKNLPNPICLFLNYLYRARFLPLSTLEQHFLNKHIRELMVELLENTAEHLNKRVTAEK